MQLNRDNYFSKEAEDLYLGSSSFKSWDIFHGGCEAKQVAIKNGEWIEPLKSAFLLGSYVHAWSEDNIQEFIKDNYSKIYKKNGSLYADFEKADKMIDVLKNDPAVELMRKGEKEKIFTGKIGGVDFKIQVDILNLKENRFCDIKTTKSIYEKYWNDETKAKESFILKYDYTLQMALYAEIIRQNLGNIDYLDSYIIAVDKQEQPDHEIIYMGKNFIKEKLEEIEIKLPHIIEVKNGLVDPIRCEKCEYCRSTKRIRKPIHYLDL